MDYEGASDRNIEGNKLFGVHKVNTETGFISAIENSYTNHLSSNK
jgi:hypothetical protein